MGCFWIETILGYRFEREDVGNLQVNTVGTDFACKITGWEASRNRKEY